MFLKRATGGGGGRRAATAGRVGWLPRGLGCHQEPWAQTADLAHTWTPRLSLGKNKADPIYARWDKLTVVQNAQTGAIPSKQAFGSNNITGRCWCYQSSHNSGSVPCNEKVFFSCFSVCMIKAQTHTHTHVSTIYTFVLFEDAWGRHVLSVWCSQALLVMTDWLSDLGPGEVIWLLWWRPFAQPLTLLAHSTEDRPSAAHPFTLLNLIISLQFLPPGNRLINTHTLCPDPVFSHKLITASDLLPALQRLGYIGLTLWENPVMTHIWQAE